MRGFFLFRNPSSSSSPPLVLVDSGSGEGREGEREGGERGNREKRGEYTCTRKGGCMGKGKGKGDTKGGKRRKEHTHIDLYRGQLQLYL